MRVRATRAVWLGSFRWLLVGATLAAGPTAGAQTANLKLGNPSDATADPAQRDNYLLDRPAFATSYNNSRGTPNWVSWRLAKSDLGTAPRDNFEPDADLPAGFLRVTPAEYNGSGFDRGHMCPHGDRTATPELSRATFVMTNIIPQSHNLNTRSWETLEDYCRMKATAGKTCYIVAGPAGVGGVGKDGPAPATPDGKVTVPAQNWKVALILDRDVATAADITAETDFRLLAAIFPNSDSEATGESTDPYMTSVNEVEALTGYTFFSAVDPAVLRQAKAQALGITDPTRPVQARTVDPDPRTIAASNLVVPQFVFARQAPARVAPMLMRPAGEQPPRPEARATPDSPIVAELKKAVAGLTYPSEADEPFTVVDLGPFEGKLTEARLWNLAKQPAGVRVERIPLDQFFERLTRTPRQSGSQVDPERAGKFAALKATLERELADPAAYRVGQGETAIYILGRTKDGHLVGVATTATET